MKIQMIQVVSVAGETVERRYLLMSLKHFMGIYWEAGISSILICYVKHDLLVTMVMCFGKDKLLQKP